MSFLRTLSLMLLGCCFIVGCTSEEPPADPPAADTDHESEAGSGSGEEHADEGAGSESK
ncbi:MAG: hypothetical protein NXI04_02555 [Planctomycetaceae bacterium]|nr:hypothetical protein [Planctomycetaceae bacterium]